MSTAPPLPPAPPGSPPRGPKPPSPTPLGSRQPLTGDRQGRQQAQNQPAPQPSETASAKPQEKLSTALTGLLPGAILKGTIGGTVSEGSGELVLETAASAHRLVGEVKVAPGDEVELRIVSLDTGVRAELRSVNGEPRATPVMLESVAAAARETTAPPNPGTTLVGTVIATPATGDSGPLGEPRLGLEAGSAIELRVASAGLPSGDRGQISQPQVHGTVVETTANRAVLETATGRLALAVSAAEPGTRVSFAATAAPAPAEPLPLAPDAVVAATPSSGPAMAVRVISVDAPLIQGTVTEASDNRAVLETASGRLELAVSGADAGMRLTVATTEAPPPPAPVPLAGDAIVAATPDSGSVMALRVVSVEAPQIQGTVVEATENSAVVETASGRLELAVNGAMPGTRLTVAATDTPPPPAPLPLARNALVAAKPESGSAMALHIVSLETPTAEIRGTVVEVGGDKTVVETSSGRLSLALSAPVPLGTRITAQLVPEVPPAATAPLIPDSVVAGRVEKAVPAGQSGFAAGADIALRISATEPPPPRLQGTVVDVTETRTAIETPAGRLQAPAPSGAELGARIEVEVVTPPPQAATADATITATPGSVIAARAETAITLGSTIVAPQETLTLRIVSLTGRRQEPPRLSAQVVSTAAGQALVETPIGELTMAAEASIGQRLQLDIISRDAGVHRAVTQATPQPPETTEPLAPGRQVAAEIVGSGQPLVLRVVAVEATELTGTVVEASESRAVVETESGRLELAVTGAQAGARVAVATVDAAPPPAPVPLAREAIVQAQPETGPALAVRIIAVEAPQIQGTVVEASESRAVVETESGRLELTVTGAQAGARIAVATTDAAPPPAPVPLAREAIVAAQPEAGPAVAMRIASIEAPVIHGTVVESRENRAVIETASGRLALAVSGVELGARISIASSDSPPPPAPVPLAREAIVSAQPESGPAFAVKIVSVESPALRLQAVVVAATEGRAEVETPLGRLVLAASAEVGSRLDLEVLGPAATVSQVPKGGIEPGREIAAEIAGSGQSLQLRVAAVAPPAPQLQGTVVAVSKNSAVIETDQGRLNLMLSTPPVLATRISAEIVEVDPPSAAAPLAADRVVAARVETTVETGATALAAGSVLALRISEFEPPAQRLRGSVVDSGAERTLISSDIGRLSVASAESPMALPLAARIEAEIMPPPAPPSETPSQVGGGVVTARAESVLTTAGNIVSPGQELALRLLSVTEPALQPDRIRGTVVASSEGRAQVETNAGRLALAVEASVGQRLEFDVISRDAGVRQALPAPPPGSLQPGQQIAAEEVSGGQPLVLRVVATEAPPVPIEGRVVESGPDRLIVTTESGRLALATVSPLPRDSVVDLEVVATPGRATPQPLLAGAVVAATLESMEPEVGVAPAMPLAGLEIGALLAVRVSGVALPDSQPLPEPGARLTAQVVAQEGNRAIAAAAGNRFSLPQAAALGSKVTLEMLPGSTPEARLVEPGGGPLPPPAAASPGLPRLEAIVAGTSEAGRLLLDTATARLAVAGVEGRPGTALALDLVSRGSPPDGLTEAPQLAVGEQVTAIVVAVQAEPQGARPDLHFEPGTPLVLRIAAIAGQGATGTTGTAASEGKVPAITAPALLAGSDPNRLIGVVSGLAPGGELLVQTREGLLALQSDTRPAAGTVLEFEILAVQPAGQTAPSQIATVSMPPGDPPPIAIGQAWPALGETVAALQNLDVALAQNLAANVMPAANGRLASAILLFVAALRGGDVRGWLGDEAGRALERGGRRDLMARLGRDLGQFNRATEEPVSGDWRALPVPFQDGRELRQLWLYFRPIDPDESAAGRDGGGGDESGMRFVLDLELSALGPLQLSGLVRERSFDLIVHSQRPLGAGVQQEIQAIFAEGSALGNATGNLAFRSGPPYPRSPTQDAGNPSSHEIKT